MFPAIIDRPSGIACIARMAFMRLQSSCAEASSSAPRHERSIGMYSSALYAYDLPPNVTVGTRSLAASGCRPRRKGWFVSATLVSRAPMGLPVTGWRAPNRIAGETNLYWPERIWLRARSPHATSA